MDEQTCHIGILYARLFIPHAQSLKEKRSVLKSLKDRVRAQSAQFNVAVAEVGDLDKWQLSTLALVNVANDQREIDAALQHLLMFIKKELSGRDRGA
jgi:uncharacterized protein YlxP (DUF503 family)